MGSSIFGKVIKAKHTKTGTWRVIKIIPKKKVK
jgi:hypothetical protein